MLPKRLRLDSREVKDVLAKGTSMTVGPYRGKYLPGRKPLGVAVIVPKRAVRTAVARNSARRRVYRELETLTLPPSGALALFVRSH